ncbi:hypothetical protein LTR06_008971 [Exophiala xenobiotica]|nr:hypothetical protein LTR06_008971 [Exophiala xenobiotica]
MAGNSDVDYMQASRHSGELVCSYERHTGQRFGRRPDCASTQFSSAAEQEGSARILSKFGKVEQKPFSMSQPSIFVTAGVDGTGAKQAWCAKIVKDATLSTNTPAI